MDIREAELLQHSQQLTLQENTLKTTQNQLNIQRAEISALIQECDEKMIKIENDNNLILYKKLELSSIHREVLSNKATSIRSAHSHQQQLYTTNNSNNYNNNNNNNVLYTNQSSSSPMNKHANSKGGQIWLLKPVHTTTSTTAHSNNNNNMNYMVRRSWSGPLPVPAHIANTMQRWNQVDKENDLRAAYATAGNATAAAQGRTPSSSMYMESSNTAQETATPRPEDNDDDNDNNNNIRQQKPIPASAHTGMPYLYHIHIYRSVHIASSHTYPVYTSYLSICIRTSIYRHHILAAPQPLRCDSIAYIQPFQPYLWRLPPRPSTQSRNFRNRKRLFTIDTVE